MGTFFVSIVLCIVVYLAIRAMIQDKKKGKSISCGMDCSKCTSICKDIGRFQQEQKK